MKAFASIAQPALSPKMLNAETKELTAFGIAVRIRRDDLRSDPPTADHTIRPIIDGTINSRTPMRAPDSRRSSVTNARTN